MKHLTLRIKQLALSKRKGKAKRWSYVASVVNPILRDSGSGLSLSTVHYRSLAQVDLLTTSPECINHSFAKYNKDSCTSDTAHVGIVPDMYDYLSDPDNLLKVHNVLIRRHKRKTNIVTLLWVVGLLLYLALVVFF